MTEHSDLIPDLDSEDVFEVQMRGYSRRQVNEFVARARSEKRDYEERLSRALDEVERLRSEVAAARQRELEDKPAHQELSERMAQILKLADDEAKAQKSRALDDITKQRAEAKQEIDRLKAEAREQTERMLRRRAGAGREHHRHRAGRVREGPQHGPEPRPSARSATRRRSRRTRSRPPRPRPSRCWTRRPRGPPRSTTAPSAG